MEHEEQQPKLHLPLLSQKGRSSAAGTQNIEIPPRVLMASAARSVRRQQLSPLSGGRKENWEGEMNVRETPFHAGLARSWNRRAGKRTASECLLSVMLKDEKDGCCSLPSSRAGSRDKLSILLFLEAGLNSDRPAVQHFQQRYWRHLYGALQ